MFPSTSFNIYGNKTITGIKNGILSAWADIFTWTDTKVYTPIKNALISWFPSESFNPYGTQVITGIKNGISNAWANIHNWVYNNVYAPINNAFSAFLTSGNFSGFGGNIISGLLSGIRDGLSNIWDWCRTNVYDRIYDTIKSQFGISSPAKKMMPLGDYIAQGLGEGITDGMADVIKDINDEMRDLIEAFNIGENPLVIWADDVWLAINEKLTMAIEKVKELAILTQQGFTLQANMNGFNLTRDSFSNVPINEKDTAGADYLADAIVSRLGPILAQNRDRDNNGASTDSLRPLYVGTLVADERGLRELEKKMRVITEAENERRGR